MHIPADVPPSSHEKFKHNYTTFMRDARPLLFAVDHKIEHMHDDFIHDDTLADPTHIFDIAQQGKPSALATHLGLITHYGNDYPDIPYIVKMNAKTHLIPKQAKDPFSRSLWTIEQLAATQKNNHFDIIGIGYVLYLGSEYETDMMHEAAQLIYKAHQQGLLTFLWCYPRGQYVAAETSPASIIGAAGVAASLGADFVKLQLPYTQHDMLDINTINLACVAAGKTKVLTAGGKQSTQFLDTTQQLCTKTNVTGIAAGRNFFQLPTQQGINLMQKTNLILKKA